MECRLSLASCQQKTAKGGFLFPFLVGQGFEADNEPCACCPQSSDNYRLAEAPRFELGLEHNPTVGFQDRSLKPLGYASVLVIHPGLEPGT